MGSKSSLMVAQPLYTALALFSRSKPVMALYIRQSSASALSREAMLDYSHIPETFSQPILLISQNLAERLPEPLDHTSEHLQKFSIDIMYNGHSWSAEGLAAQVSD